MSTRKSDYVYVCKLERNGDRGFNKYPTYLFNEVSFLRVVFDPSNQALHWSTVFATHGHGRRETHGQVHGRLHSQSGLVPHEPTQCLV